MLIRSSEMAGWDLMRRARNNQKGMPMVFFGSDKESAREWVLPPIQGPPAKILSLGHYSRLTWNFHDFSYSRKVPFRTWNIYQTLDLGRGRQRQGAD